jgi:hypothetical protein
MQQKSAQMETRKCDKNYKPQSSKTYLEDLWRQNSNLLSITKKLEGIDLTIKRMHNWNGGSGTRKPTQDCYIQSERLSETTETAQKELEERDNYVIQLQHTGNKHRNEAKCCLRSCKKQSVKEVSCRYSSENAK